MFSKTTGSGITSFYSLFLNPLDQIALFEYRHEGLDEGFRTVLLPQVDIADGQFHHLTVSVYGSSLALFIDGQLHLDQHMQLIAALEDGPGVFFLGRKQGDSSRFSGKPTETLKIMCFL